MTAQSKNYAIQPQNYAMILILRDDHQNPPTEIRLSPGDYFTFHRKSRCLSGHRRNAPEKGIPSVDLLWCIPSTKNSEDKLFFGNHLEQEADEETIRRTIVQFLTRFLIVKGYREFSISSFSELPEEWLTFRLVELT